MTREENKIAAKVTLEEVIETLQTWIATADDEYDREEMGRVFGLKEALHEIKKIKTCTDAISRKQTLDAFGLSANTRKYGGDHSGYNTMMLYEIQEVIEGLPSVSCSGKPNRCEDAISRKAAIDAVRWGQSYISMVAPDGTVYHPYECENVALEDAVDRIAELPSVSTEKTGCWVEIDDEPHEVWECDHCGFVIDGSGCIDPYEYRDTYKYCPNCGVKMREVGDTD